MDEKGSLIAAGGMEEWRHASIYQSSRYRRVYSRVQRRKNGMKTRIVRSPNRRVKADLLKRRHNQTESCQIFFQVMEETRDLLLEESWVACSVASSCEPKLVT